MSAHLASGPSKSCNGNGASISSFCCSQRKGFLAITILMHSVCHLLHSSASRCLSQMFPCQFLTGSQSRQFVLKTEGETTNKNHPNNKNNQKEKKGRNFSQHNWVTLSVTSRAIVNFQWGVGKQDPLLRYLC